MNLQPYYTTITNKTPEQLTSILKSCSENDFNIVKDLFLPNYEIDSLTELFMASPETFNQLLKYYQKLGIEVKYSVKKGKDYLFANQSQINTTGTNEFVCCSVQYILDNFDQDDVYQKINQGTKDITPAEQYLLQESC